MLSMRCAGDGRMLIVDASCLAEVLVNGLHSEAVRQAMLSDTDLVAPHVIDAEVLGTIRFLYLRGYLDGTAAYQAVEDLRSWPGDRFGHRLLVERAWELRDTVRSWDALYVALAELTGSALITLDLRLARAPGPRCDIRVVSP